jgi:dethiobiotin synthetase
VRSPLTHDGDVVALCRALAPDLVLLVAEAGLGMINSVRLSVAALLAGADGPVVVVMNRYDGRDDLHVRNRRWLTEHDGLGVVGMPGEESALTALVRGK